MAKKKTRKAAGKSKKVTTRKKSRPRKKTTKKATKKRARKTSSYFLSDVETEALLSAGLEDQHDKLIQTLGRENFDELRSLLKQRRQASTARFFGKRGRVILLPGILGSTMGTKSNLIWLDPIDLAKGHFTKLKLPDSGKYDSLGVIPFQYTMLKLRLEIAGYDAEFFHYDWRQSLDTLGDRLAKRLEKEDDGVSLVAHSMGGLVSRMAMATLPTEKISKLIMMGTPNYGSFVPALVIRENHDTIWTVSKIDFQNGTRDFAETFNSFHGLMQMLPRDPRSSGLDLYDMENWPIGDRLVPVPSMLQRAKEVTEKLLPEDDPRCHAIVGFNQETVVGVNLTDDNSQFVYQRSLDGDATVPAALSVMDESRTWYVNDSHTGMVNNRSVAGAIKQLLSGQRVTKLKSTKPSLERTRLAPLTEREWMIPEQSKKELSDWTDTELRELAPGFISSQAGTDIDRDDAAENAGEVVHQPKDVELNNLILSRRKQERFEINLAYGDVSQLKTRALVLGMFQAVKPTGPAAVLDRLLDGTISEFVDRHMFSARVGEVQIIPTIRQDVRCELIVLAGLGAFDQFSEDVMRRVAENVGRCLLRSHIDEIGTVLVGSNSKLSIEQSMRALLGGFFNSIKDSPEDLSRTFRGVTVCEFDKTRFKQVKNTIYGLASTGLFENHEVVLDEMELESTAPIRTRTRSDAEEDPVYLIARSEGRFTEDDEETVDSGTTILNLSVLRASGKGAVVSENVELDNSVIEDLTDLVARRAPASVEEYGKQWAELILTDEIREVREILLNQSEHHLAIVHDRFASKIPWEALHIRGAGAGVWSAAAHKGVSRRYLAQNMAAAAWLNERRQGELLDVLLVIDPTEDLPGAEIEGQHLSDLLSDHSSIRIETVKGHEATKERLMTEFSSGSYDVVHYAGHAYFDRESPSNSGVVCAGEQVLSGRDLLGINNLPLLMFFNACEAARVRKRGPERYEVIKNIETAEVSRANTGLAEAFLRGGVANYIGTFWPVNDNGAKQFAKVFYQFLLDGQPIGDAVQAGRNELKTNGNQDWANYILFGDPWFRLRIQTGQNE